MNSVTKKIMIIAGALIIVGTAFAFTAIAMVGFNWGSLGNQLPYEDKELYLRFEQRHYGFICE